MVEDEKKISFIENLRYVAEVALPVVAIVAIVALAWFGVEAIQAIV